jgi:putative hemin transport protein
MNPVSREQQGASSTAAAGDAWTRFRAQGPGTHARDFAKTVGLSEAALLDLGRGAEVVRLQPRWEELFAALPQLGSVKSMSRNEFIVLEHWGHYQGEDAKEAATNEPVIDLRIFFRHWGSAFALSETGSKGTRRSVQFFDRHGDSVHKAYVEDDARIAAFDELVSRFRDDAPGPLQVTPPTVAPSPDTPVDVTTFRAEWDALKDTHEFVMLLARHKLPRVQALRMAGESRATEVGADSLRRILESVAANETPFMIFVGNRGLMQIFTGTIRAVKAQNGWVNVFDKGLNLHAKEAGIASAFIVRKPTSDGVVTSLELFDEAGETLALLFGERSFGQPESPVWRARLDELLAR